MSREGRCAWHSTHGGGGGGTGGKEGRAERQAILFSVLLPSLPVSQTAQGCCLHLPILSFSSAEKAEVQISFLMKNLFIFSGLNKKLIYLTGLLTNSGN